MYSRLAFYYAGIYNLINRQKIKGVFEMARKSKEQARKDREQRAELREVQKQTEAREKRDMQTRQRAEREELRERQAKRRAEESTTHAGGKREGAGRKPSIPHNESLIAGVDLNPKRTYTFYGAADERRAVKKFLNVWRELRFKLSPEERVELLQKFNGLTIYELMTDGTLIDQREIRRIKRKLPSLTKYINEISPSLPAGGGADEQEGID